MPCISKKMEVRRPQLTSAIEGTPDTDEVITTEELSIMIRQAGINWVTLEEEDFDHPFGAFNRCWCNFRGDRWCYGSSN
eukprot:gnl/Chilomastix_caulleri/5510.p1 GENE.gnl/Chilomastix_caulleri/5510~~gnl/Chilomastix_caulleri/5510.p1  ORF type:complete len:79 (+),score=10.75 gnl/Chilomastix_caulleri/5510:245-481(+)